MPINLIPLSFKIFPLKHKMFCKVKTFNLLYFSTAKYIFRNHQNNCYLNQHVKETNSLKLQNNTAKPQNNLELWYLYWYITHPFN